MRIKSSYYLLLVIACLCSPLATATVSGQQPPLPTKKILIFSAEPYGKVVELLDETIQKTLRNNPNYIVQFYRENLDNARIPGEKFESEFVTLLNRKYDAQTPDLIFALGFASLEFLLRHENDLFKGVPKVFYTPEIGTITNLQLGQHTTGISGKMEMVPTVELMLAQNPATKKIWVITGQTERDRRILERAKKEFAVFAGRVEFVYPENQTIEQLRETVSSLPRDNLVYFVAYGRDAANREFSNPEGVSILAPTSAVPIYGTTDNVIGVGAIGGDVMSFRHLATGAAEMGLRILAGEEPRNIPPQIGRNVPMFDWRQLQKWGIDENTLPSGSIVEYRIPSVWEQYRAYIAATIALILFQSMLIASLLLTRPRRRKAELERNEFQAMAAAEHQKLDEVVSNVPGVVWESSLEPGDALRTTRFVSEYAEKMLGYPLDAWLSTPGFLLTIVLEEDRDHVARELQEIIDSGKEGVLQFRWRAKDGRVFWAEAHVVAMRGEDGTSVGLRGVTLDITERKVAEEKLQVSELELKEAQRVSQIGNWEWEPRSDTVRWSEELYRIAGLDPSLPAPSYEEHSNFYTTESLVRLASVVEEAMENGTPYELELELIRADNLEHILVNARGEVIRGRDSEVIGLRGTVQDITFRKKAEEALRESEARYRNVVETQTELICHYLPDTTLTFVNDAYCRYFGKTYDELIGTKFIEFIPPHDRAVVLDRVSSLVQTHRTEMYEHEVIRPDGSRGWQQWIDSGVETLNGNPKEVQGIGQDITERRQVEEALRSSENRFRTMADSAPVLIWMWDPDMNCTYVNQGWLDFTGRLLKAELGDGWMGNLHREDLDSVRERINTAYARRAPFRFEFRLRGADSIYRWLYNSGTPRFSTDGDFLGYIGSCVDISDRKEAEEATKIAHEEVVRLQKQLQEENVYLKEVIKLEHNFEEIIGHSNALKYVLFKIEQVAPTDAAVLITGETGTGKELVARAIHNTSRRKNRPLVRVNCAALSASLIESELFGHERGSFTGANSRKIGRFELADGATLFLDEVGELPIELQVKLLRVLQEGEFERLGSSTTIKVDVRIIAATNRDLDAEVRKGSFRKDLLFRLNVFPITVPALRERKEDLPELIQHFTSRFAKKLGKNIKSVSPATIRRLSEHSWPGNVRELANVIERSVINAQTENLSVLERLSSRGDEAEQFDIDHSLEMIERKHITHILELKNWRIEGENGAARVLGLNPSTLRTRMAKLGVHKRSQQNDNNLM